MTSFIDGSTIYGSSKEEAESLRTFSLGQLKVQYNDNYDELLSADLNSLDCRDSAGKKCFKSGDVRVNEHPGIAAMASQYNYIEQSNVVAPVNFTRFRLTSCWDMRIELHLKACPFLKFRGRVRPTPQPTHTQAFMEDSSSILATWDKPFGEALYIPRTCFTSPKVTRARVI